MDINCVLPGDLNIVRDNTQLQNFCESFLLEHPIKKPTCYKEDTPAGTERIITNIPQLFKKSMVIKTGISDHHKISKCKAKTFYYYCYKKFNLEQLQMELKEKADEISNNSFDTFPKEFKKRIDKLFYSKTKK